MTDKDMFERLGKHLFFLTQDADEDVFNRWKEIGLTQEFANFIVTKKNELETEYERSYHENRKRTNSKKEKRNVEPDRKETLWKDIKLSTITWVLEYAKNKDRLEEAFLKIHGTNWKDAFTCEVPEKDFKLYDDACVYHTGAMLQKVSVCDGIVQCYCDGYYHAMDGWV